MAAEDATEGAVGVLERPETEDEQRVEIKEAPETAEAGVRVEEEKPKRRGLFGRRKAAANREEEGEDELEREIEFETPFGKFEIEFAPTSKRKKKEEKRKAEAARKAAEEAKKAQAKLLEKQRKQAQKGGSGMGRLLVILLVVGLVVAAIGVAYWLFARKPEELDEIPDDLRSEPVAEPQGALDKLCARVRKAIRAGQKASSEAQREQQRRYEEMAGRT